MLDRRRAFLRASAVASAGLAVSGYRGIRSTALAVYEGEPEPVVMLPSGPAVRDPYGSTAGLLWWRGQLHTHTSRSFDGDPAVSPERRAALYQAQGYDFAFFTDHDRVTSIPNRMNGAAGEAENAPGGRAFLVLPGVESTHESAHLGVWLAGAEAAHNVIDPPAVTSSRLPAVRIEEWAAGGALVCCNHPSHSSAPLTASQVEGWAVAGLPFRFLEVFNTKANPSNQGLDYNLEVWRRAITAAGPQRPIWGVATDDSHSHGVGPGWVAVAAPMLTAQAVREALLAGRFYASSGLDFTFLGVSPEYGGILASAPGATTIRFVNAGGLPCGQIAGDTGFYTPQAADRWVRVEASDSVGHMAWSQPFWLDA